MIRGVWLMGEVESVVAVKVSSLNDIARLAASLISMGQPSYIVKFYEGDKPVYGLFAIFRDYYKLYGVPMIYYHPVDRDNKDSKYVLVKTDGVEEEVKLSPTTKPGYIAVPIIVLAEKPSFIKVKL